jgi:GDP-4-dehydro-6-deoxy-D-mannose reductase
VAFEHNLVSEDAPLGPRRGYGITKLAAEQLACQAADEGLDVLIARAFQHAGPRQGPRMMLSEWISQLAADDDSPVRVRTLDAYIDLTDVRDVVRAYRLLVDLGTSGMIYNVGSGVCRRSGDVLELVRNRLGRRRTIVETRPGQKQDPIAATGRILRATGWQANIGLEQTVAQTVDFWLCRARLEREASA